MSNPLRVEVTDSATKIYDGGGVVGPGTVVVVQSAVVFTVGEDNTITVSTTKDTKGFIVAADTPFGIGVGPGYDVIWAIRAIGTDIVEVWARGPGA